MIQCPVCKNKLREDLMICEVCGFDQLNHNFVSEADAKQWFQCTVEPCRAVWTHMQASLETANMEMEKYRALYIRTLEENIELLEDYKSLLELQASHFSPSSRFNTSDSAIEAFIAGEEDDELPF